jgi:hypothetical protein
MTMQTKIGESLGFLSAFLYAYSSVASQARDDLLNFLERKAGTFGDNDRLKTMNQEIFSHLHLPFFPAFFPDSFFPFFVVTEDIPEYFEQFH